MRAYSLPLLRIAIHSCSARLSSSTPTSADTDNSSDMRDVPDAYVRTDEVLFAPPPRRAPVATPQPQRNPFPPLPALRPRPAFSFLRDPNEPRGLTTTAAVATSLDTVPNNAPPPLLPAWASSLTSPRLWQQRHVAENWIAPDVTDVLPDADTKEFLSWLRERIGKDAADVLERNVEFHLHARFARGVLARRSFARGDVIFSIPLSADFGAVIHAESLEKHSAAAARLRHVPSFDAIVSAITRRASQFDPMPHVLFAEQLYTALLLACERSDGPRSSLWPYMRLLSDIDDDFVCETHRDVLDPASLLEYKDHCWRFDDLLRRVQAMWADAPPFDDMRWALRVMLSRQRMFPIRRGTKSLEAAHSDSRAATSFSLQSSSPMALLGSFGSSLSGRLGTMGLWWNVQRLQSNAFDPNVTACLVPPLCMLQHPPGGTANAEIEVSEGAITVRAAEEIEEADTITLSFTRCYSVSYTLYRFGFLPLRPREVDAAEHLKDALGSAHG